MALWVKIGIHKKKGRSRTNIPGICGVAGEGHRIYAGPYRVPPGRYSFPVLSAGEPVCRGVFWQIFSYAWRWRRGFCRSFFLAADSNFVYLQDEVTKRV